MSSQLVGILAAIFAAQARIEGMKAENSLRECQGNSPAYGEDAFNHEAAFLQHLEIEARNAS